MRLAGIVEDQASGRGREQFLKTDPNGQEEGRKYPSDDMVEPKGHFPVSIERVDGVVKDKTFDKHPIDGGHGGVDAQAFERLAKGFLTKTRKRKIRTLFAANVHFSFGFDSKNEKRSGNNSTNCTTCTLVQSIKNVLTATNDGCLWQKWAG